MNTVNHGVTTIFGFLCGPFSELDPIWGLTALSVFTGIVMLLIFRLTSNQKGIRKAKNRIKAHFLELRLYNDDLRLMVTAQKDILKSTLGYMRYSVVPMLFLIVPVVLIMIQLSLWYDRRPLAPGDAALVTVHYRSSASFDEHVALRVPEGLKVETPPVRIPEKKEVVWRIKALNPGSYELAFEGNPATVIKQLVAGENLAQISVKRVGPGFYRQLLHPGERALSPEAGIDAIEVAYPAISYTVLGWNIHWLVIFFVVSIAAGFLLKGVFRVEV